MENRSLTGLVRQQRAAARTASSGRSSHTVYGGHKVVALPALGVVLAAGLLA